MKHWIRLIPFLGVAQLTSSLAQAPFTRVTGGPLDDSTASYGCSLADYDGDGDPDIFLAASPPNNRLYRNDRGFQFTQVTDGPIVTDDADSTGGVWADFDNDGDLDLFVPNFESPAADFFYRNDGGGQFTRIIDGPWVRDSRIGLSAAWADFDSDGFVDLYVANWQANAFLWRNNGQGNVALAPGPVTSTSYGHSGSAWADYDNDGDPDLFVSCTLGSTGQQDLFFENQGDGTFQPVLDGPHVSLVRRTGAVVWGDYDNDGDFDLFVGAGLAAAPVPESDLPDLLYQNNGDRTFTRILEGPPVNDRVLTYGAAWGDYDNDGYLDLFVANQDGADLLYHNERDGTFSQVLEGEIVNDQSHSRVSQWADFDNDGFLDLYVCTWDGYTLLPEPDLLYRNQGNPNAWIMIRLVGTVSNRAAIGAKVRVRTTIWGKEVWQLRQISGGEGGSQGDLRAHFGLGDATKVTNLRIEWPSGIVQEFQNVAARQTLTITEPARLVPLGPREFQIRCWKGMRFEVEKSPNLQTWASLGVVTNETGTLTFQDSQGSAGANCCFYRVMSR